jgi:hypothetical protein
MARSIVLDGKTYRYTVGDAFVRITGPDGKSKAFDVLEVAGMSRDEIERGRTVSIIPSDIEKFIREHVMIEGVK